MPQLSLNIDEDILRKIEKGAEISNTSISTFVAAVLKEHFYKSWPEGFDNLFGSINDDSFVKPAATDSSLDAAREKL